MGEAGGRCRGRIALKVKERGGTEMGSKRYCTLMGISGGVVTKETTGGELRVRTIGEEQGEEGLETSCEWGRVEVESLGDPLGPS